MPWPLESARAMPGTGMPPAHFLALSKLEVTMAAALSYKPARQMERGLRTQDCWHPSAFTSWL